MHAPRTNVLVITQSSGGVESLRRALDGNGSRGAVDLLHPPLAPSEGLQRLAGGGIDVVLLDVTGAVPSGLDTLRRARAEAPDVPIVLLADAGDAIVGAGERAAEAGAQDVLTADELDAGDLPRVLRYAIERHRLRRTMRELALDDELTGLYNQRGFLALCDHHVRLASRMRGLLLAVVDIDGLQRINERFGRAEGDRALVRTAHVLRATFRASDVIARLADDDFAVIVVDAASDATGAVMARLRMRLDRMNAEHRDGGYVLSLTMGTVRVDAHALASTESMLIRAEEELRALKGR